MNWAEIQQAYEQVKEARDKGRKSRVVGKGFVVYSMGANNPVIYINIKENR